MTDRDDCILALDQGTTSSRALVFDRAGGVVAKAQEEFAQIYPHPGWVEHDPRAIWDTSVRTARAALDEAQSRGAKVAAVGVTNQRETTLVWDRATGEPIANAIVWQDRRTAETCRRLAGDGHDIMIANRTGLVLDPYFSASKIAWILDNTPGARERAAVGGLAFGTVDSFLIWRLTGGLVHATDATNASRTSLYNIVRGEWDEDLCALFNVPLSLLPEVRDSAGAYGTAQAHVLGRALPIRGVAGDQQAALVGQACFASGDVKSTYGTGAFLVLNTGDKLVRSDNRLLTTIAYQIDGRATYALEGSILSAGSTIQWLRDGLGLIANAGEVEELARQGDPDAGVYLVPAFTGLGAPHWDADARAAILGLTRGTGRAEIARAALESVAFQTRDLLDAMAADGMSPTRLKVDGGMISNQWLLNVLADLCALDVVAPRNQETTAYGAAILAALGAGLTSSLDEAASAWRAAGQYAPSISARERDARLAGWRAAVARVRSQTAVA